jgi:hypothetical protein
VNSLLKSIRVLLDDAGLEKARGTIARAASILVGFEGAANTLTRKAKGKGKDKEVLHLREMLMGMLVYCTTRALEKRDDPTAYTFVKADIEQMLKNTLPTSKFTMDLP